MPVRHQLRARFWLEAVTAVLSAVLAIVTLVIPQWFEMLFEAEPDGGSGALEWAVVAVLAVTAATSALLAVVEWRHTAAQPAR